MLNHDRIEILSEQLHGIYSRETLTEEEKECLELATMGLFYIASINKLNHFEKYLLESKEPLGEEEKKYLKSIGLDE